jgi:hypothetical protein
MTGRDKEDEKEREEKERQADTGREKYEAYRYTAADDPKKYRYNIG